MGKEYAQQIESSVKLIQDPVITEYVNRVGQNLVRNSDAQVPFTIKVIDSDEVNAMALPGGFFYVNSGLILAADEEAELAGVMAHEIAHVAARHITRQMTRGQYANLATIPLIFVGGGIGYAVRSAAGLGLPLTFLSFQRGFEAEADYLGLQYMTISGTVNKTGILVICSVATAAWTWNLFLNARSPEAVMPLGLLGMIGGLIVAVVTIFKKTWAPITAPLYALLEGLVLGSVSAMLVGECSRFCRENLE